ncbi:MAG: ATP-binding protein [Burkholderiaceae bacterium]|nr:ATP-binding protein [Burkholderiaceae bacterium]
MNAALNAAAGSAPPPATQEVTASAISADLSTTDATAAPRERWFALGKYREIAFAVAFFLVFDLAVLVVNFYSSYRIAEDAVAINLAGRQRMLSQRMTKALLDIDAERAAGRSGQSSLDELDAASRLFGSTLEAFSRGGLVLGGDGAQVALGAAGSVQSQALLARALHVWGPTQRAVAALLAQRTAVEPAVLRSAVDIARTSNLELLDLMNRLTTQLEDEARGTAGFLRQVQLAGISLALLNFLFILFKFIRRLRENDARIERAQRETREILGTVKEGLFLLDAQRRVGAQRSASLATILGGDPPPQADFFALLAPLVSLEVLASARDYVDLLFAGRVREGLVQGLNPLADVELMQPDRSGKLRPRYLSFQFNRVLSAGEVVHLLVTVQDVTERVRLAGELAAAKRQARAELDVLLRLLETDPAALRGFLERAELALDEVNGRFKSAADHAGADYPKLMAHAVATVHGIKGDAAVLGLAMFETLAHEFERDLAAARDQRGAGGDALVKLTLRLDELFERLTMIREIVQRLGSRAAGEPARVPVAAAAGGADFLGSLRALAERIAREQGKSVDVVGDVQLLGQLPDDTAAELRSIAVQLLRNAVTHGIEAEDARRAAGKAPQGLIQIDCHRTDDGRAIEFVLRDDGRGIAPARIRAALVDGGHLAPDQAAQMSDSALLRHIFTSGLSTAPAVDLHAGRGAGMDVVWRKLQALGGRIRLQTQIDRFTQFTLVVAPPAPQPMQAAE